MYSVKNIKRFRGMEGHGYNATLCRDGKKVAFVMDSGDGGEANFEWNDRTAPKVDITIDYFGDGRTHTYQGTPEEKLFLELANSQTYTAYGHTGRKDGAILIEELIETDKFRKDCKTKTLFRLASDGEDTYQVYKERFDHEVRAWLVRQYGDQLVEIINERPEIREG